MSLAGTFLYYFLIRRVLKHLPDDLNPIDGFNQHNQGSRTSENGRPASISLLSVAYDSARSVNAALRAALEGSRPTLVVASDVRSGRPGSADEASTGDAAHASTNPATASATMTGTVRGAREGIAVTRPPATTTTQKPSGARTGC